MKKSFLKLHAILWTIVIIAIVIDFNAKRETIDLNVHDTYYVIAKIQVYIGIAIYFGIVTLLYWLFFKVKKMTNKLFDIIYFILMLLGIIGISMLPLFDQKDIYSKNPSDIYYTIASLLIAIAQFVLMINFITALFKKRVSHL